MLAHGFQFFAKGQFSAKGHTHLRKTKELSGTTRAPSAERNFLWTLQGLWRAPYGPKDYVSWKLTYGGGFFGVYMCSRKKLLRETQKLWNENECPSTPDACLASSNPGPDFQLPNSNSNTSLQPPKRTSSSSVSKWLARVSSKSSPTGLVARYTQFFRKQKKRSSIPPQYCNGNGLQLWQILQKFDYVYGVVSNAG
jgi:hypothetical protein